MKLSSFIDSESIFTEIDGKTHEEVIISLIDKLSKKNEMISSQKETVIKAVLEREVEISTFLGNGLSMPHARLDNFNDFIICVGVLKKPITLKTVKGSDEQLTLVVLLLSGIKKNKLMLNTLSSIVKISKNEEIMHKIIASKNSEEIFDIIKQSNIEVTENLTAENIMLVAPMPASSENTLRDIAVRFVNEGISSLPVVDKFGKFIGAIEDKELISYGMPKYTEYFNDLSFLSGAEPFTKYFEDENTVKVEVVMNKKPFIITKKTAVMEIAFLMIHNNISTVYIVENGVYEGCIRREDLIKKVLHL